MSVRYADGKPWKPVSPRLLAAPPAWVASEKDGERNRVEKATRRADTSSPEASETGP
jgi:hypothetical protein